MKTIWITGGSTGIGAATAIEFNKRNWRVIISSRNLNNLEKVKDKVLKISQNKEFYIMKCDISDKLETENVVKNIEKKIAPIDLALLNAAAYSPNKTQEFNLENFETLIDVNLKGTLNCINNLQKEMGLRKKGHISIVSSPVGYRGLPTAAAYGMTKAGLINLAESLYFDFKKKGIKISIINPGFIESESTNLNTFPMPFKKSSEYAAKKIYFGLTKSYKFEIIFPYFFIFLLKIGRVLPYKIYFYLIKKITGL